MKSNPPSWMLHRLLQRFQALWQRISGLEQALSEARDHARATNQRMMFIERQLQDTLELLRFTEERSRSQHWHALQSQYALEYQREFLHNWYLESRQPKKDGVSLQTEYPLATSSADHQWPDSTVEGVQRPISFVAHCREVVGSGLRLLDLGTGSGGLIYEASMQGLLAVGLDGSDHCRRHRIGYWPLLPDHLLTCDITQPFSLSSHGEPLRFEVVTAWEVLEHIPEDGIPGLLANVRKNMSGEGWFMGSVSLLEYNSPSGEPYHITLKAPEWWREQFKQAGLEWVQDHPFDTTLFCRGNGPRFQDFHNYLQNPNEGFHFVARHHADS